jgi:hypothetical protein
MYFSETIFITTIIKQCNDIDDLDEVNIKYDETFNNIINKNNLDFIFDIYCNNEEDIADAKIRYGDNYKEIKLNLILYNLLLNYLKII